MKTAFASLFMIVLIMGSCKNNNSPAPKITEKEKINSAAAPAEDLTGVYAGNFGLSKLYLLISKITDNSVEGMSMTGGNVRPFSGKMEKQNDTWMITAKEPGDNHSDGIFKLAVNGKESSAITGSWEPYNTDAGIQKKDLNLQKKTFVYNEDAGDYPQASKRILKDDDLSNLMKPELEQMRNEIYARHGYYFTKKEVRESFENDAWYVPYYADVKDKLTQTEIKNISLIKKYEKYANDYGNDYGR